MIRILAATALLLTAASSITQKSIDSFVDLTSASVVRSIVNVALETPLALGEIYSVNLELADHVNITCKGTRTPCKVDRSSKNTFLISGVNVQNIVIQFATSKNQKPLPESVAQSPKNSQDEATQFLIYSQKLAFNSNYPASMQKVVFRLPNANLKSYTTAIKPVAKSGNSITYGPFTSLDDNAVATLHYQTSQAVLNAEFKRLVQVSHWANNVNVEDHYEIHNDGANYIDFRLFQNTHVDTNVVKSFPLSLPPNAHDVYFKDAIGNVSTSNFRPSLSNKQKASLNIRPRYPLYGGWRYKFFYGYNIPSAAYLTVNDNLYEFQFQIFDALSNISYTSADLQIQLPEGAHISYPYQADIVKSVTYTYLDTIGRPTITFSKKNLVDENAGPIVIKYHYPLYLLLLKPLAVASVIFGLYLAIFVYTRTDFSIEADPNAPAKEKVAQVASALIMNASRVDSLFESHKLAFDVFVNSKQKSVNVAAFKKGMKSFEDSIVAAIAAFGDKARALGTMYRDRLKIIQEGQLAVVTAGKSGSKATGDAISNLDRRIVEYLAQLEKSLD